ncbi:hypothetical protein L2K70_04900 [Nocardioides KLBMP 9356]|uniref:Uncharacterized protein n=1 Tax=Nocardioides potassii TaxID=2911371 RepID=A0ABS9H925_9ACTN|nr:hypothetical protein [Nocardioides potassii]MCF6376934.1 hypothetical protein [Nocardioides potassii]
MSDRIYVGSTPTNCYIGEDHGQVTAVVRDPGLAQERDRTPRAAFVHLDDGDMLHVVLGGQFGERRDWREVVSSRRISRDEFDRLNGLDALRRDLGWRDA